ncbi:MAG: hypothetical protein M0C28_24040 [Candidatus Moduliflexus flocculans]|nr:hypothetical protein [Candidatus Moduliflexus flocculans]
MQSTTIGKKLYLGFLAVIVATGVAPALLSTIPAVRRMIPQEYMLIFTGILGVVVGLVLAFFMAQSLTTEIRERWRAPPASWPRATSPRTCP